MRTLAALVLLLFACSASADAWRTYAGGYSTSWKTEGHHGHDQPCRVFTRVGTIADSSGGSIPIFGPFCDGLDFARGNLDNSIGYRFGRERDVASLGPLRLTGGFDATLSDTEYNISQSDLAIFAGSGAAGVDVERWGARVGVRYGIGAYLTSDVRHGVHSFKEVALTLPLSSGSAIRLTRGTAVHSGRFGEHVRPAGFAQRGGNATAKEFGLLLMTRPGGGGPSRWNFSALSGVSAPRSLNLSRAGFHRLSVVRDLGESPLQLQLSWTSSAHESRIEGVFNGYPKNLRSKTIDSYGLALRAGRVLPANFSAYVTAGGEIAEWTDPHGLLVTGTRLNLHVVEGGIEIGANAGVGVRWMLGGRVGLEVMGEVVHWPRLGLEERRTAIGLVVNR